MHCFKIYLQILSQHYKLSLKNAIANYILTSSSALVCRLVWFLNSKSNSKSNNCAPLKGNKSWLLQLIGNVGFHRTPCSRDKVHKIRAVHWYDAGPFLIFFENAFSKKIKNGPASYQCTALILCTLSRLHGVRWKPTLPINCKSQDLLPLRGAQLLDLLFDFEFKNQTNLQTSALDEVSM